MATVGVEPSSARIRIRVYDGTRQPLAGSVSILYRIFDGRNQSQHETELKAPDVLFPVPVFDNLFDNYRVIVSADGREDAGIQPVKVEEGKQIPVDLLLLPKNRSYNFSRAKWENLATLDPKVPDILGADLDSQDAAAQRWSDKYEKDSPTAACLLNLLTVMANSTIAGGQQLLGFLRQVIWDDEMKPDRFFGWADRSLIQRLQQPPETVNEVRFAPAPKGLHPGATSSVKARQYGEANLQLTFHENDAPPAGHPDWVKVEPDIDYFRDDLAHFFLEVIPNKFTGSLTDPAHVLALRWMAEHRAGKNFDPLYTILPG